MSTFMQIISSALSRANNKYNPEPQVHMPVDTKIASIVSKLREVDDTVHRPNAGGCAIIAHQAYTAYKKANPRRKASIIYMINKRDTKRIKKLNSNSPASCAHAIIKLGTKYYDSDTVWNSIAELRERHPYYEIIKVDPELCLKTIKRAKWNPAFNRRTEVPKINKIFGNDIRYSA